MAREPASYSGFSALSEGCRAKEAIQIDCGILIPTRSGNRQIGPKFVIGFLPVRHYGIEPIILPVYSTRTKKEHCRLPPSANALILGPVYCRISSTTRLGLTVETHVRLTVSSFGRIGNWTPDMFVEPMYTTNPAC
jgi:hypothetical protein